MMKWLAALLLVSSVAAAEPKKAVIFVGPDSNGEAILPKEVLEARHEAEKKYYEGKGYLVEIVPASQDAILNAIAGGASAISYFGAAPADALEPTVIGLNARVWKGAAAVYYSMKSQAVPANFGLEVMRNFSCRSLWDTGLAEVFVRPGGHYFGAKSDLAHDTSYEKLAGKVPGCTQGGDCRCATVGQYSAVDLKDYKLPGKFSEPAAVAAAPAAPAPEVPAAAPVPAPATVPAAPPASTAKNTVVEPLGPLSGTWYITPSGTFEVVQRGEQVTWTLSVPEYNVRHEGRGTFRNSMLNGKYSDISDPGGLRAGDYEGWQLNSDGKLCGRLTWYMKEDPSKGAGVGFDCYARAPVKK